METQNNQLEGIAVIRADYLADLLIGAAVAACTDKSSSTLNAVYLTAGEGVLTATATDRYRLITGALPIDSRDTLTALVPLEGVKRVLSAIKALPKVSRHALNSGPVVGLLTAGDILSVSIGGDTLSIELCGATFPPFEQLFTAESAPVESMQLNPAFLGAFDKVPAVKGAGHSFTFHGPTKPVTVTIPHDVIIWRGLLMPMRLSK